MARLTSIRLGKTINVGNYESKRVDVELEYDQDEDTLDDVVADANALIDYIANGGADNEKLQEYEALVDTRTKVRKYQ